MKSRSPGLARGLMATTLSDGTVGAVGFQEDKGFDAIPLILEN